MKNYFINIHIYLLLKLLTLFLYYYNNELRINIWQLITSSPTFNFIVDSEGDKTFTIDQFFKYPTDNLDFFFASVFEYFLEFCKRLQKLKY